MKKRMLSMLLAVVLCMASGVTPAFASGEGETRVGIRIGGYDTYYPYGTPASGAGWSYDGNQTLTLNGITLSGVNKDGIQLMNPDRNITIVVAAGSVNTLGSLDTMYRMGSSRRITVTMSGTGTLNCSGNIHFGGDSVVYNGPTSVTERGFYAQKLTMNSGFISAKSMALSATSVLNGGGIEYKNENTSSPAFSLQESWSGSAIAQAEGQAFVSKFIDQYGQPLRYEVKEYDTYSVGFVYDSKGEYASYARFGTAPEPTVGGFADVKQSMWYADSVQWAVEKEITNGTSATTFSPDVTCKKAQIITFLWRAAGSPQAGSSYQIPDVAAGQYYSDAVQWAADHQIIEPDENFGPDSPCTRLTAVEYMWKYAGSPDAAQAGFADVSSSAVDWAVAEGVTNGTSATTFAPDTICNRAQIVTFLYRAFA